MERAKQANLLAQQKAAASLQAERDRQDEDIRRQIAAEKDKAAQLLAKQAEEARAYAERQRVQNEYSRQQQVEKERAAQQLAKQQSDAKRQIEEQKAQSELKKQLDFERENVAQLAAKQLADMREIQKSTAGNRKSTAAAIAFNSRNSVVQQTIVFTSDSIQIALYDNGEVDGDTVSVLLNGSLIIAKQGLSTVAYRRTIYIPPSANRLELVMYAESLGLYPPNTGLLVIKDGKNIKEVRFSGDLHNNASIIFVRKKE